MTYDQIIQNHIRSSVVRQGIGDVLHFTQLKNLPTILQYGLMSYTECDALKEIVYASDADRFCDHSISVTVSSFYKKMFSAKRRGDAGPWVVLALEPRLLWELECNFYPRNLGTNEMKFCSKKKNTGYAFDRMFEDLDPCGWMDGKGYREKIGLPSNLTTYPDAEIQVMEKIPAEWISGAWVEGESDAHDVQDLLDNLPGAERDVMHGSFEPRWCYGGKEWG